MIPAWPSDGDHDLFAAIAADLLADRQRLYPGLIAKGTITVEQAADGERIMGAIASDWRRITTLYAGDAVGPRDTTATTAEKHAELEKSLARLRAIFGRLQAGLPTTFDAGPTVRAERVDCTGMSLDALIAAANDGRILPHLIRPVADARHRCSAVACMLERDLRGYGAMFAAEVTAELRSRAGLRAAA